jgi:hypothetical protein
MKHHQLPSRHRNHRVGTAIVSAEFHFGVVVCQIHDNRTDLASHQPGIRPVRKQGYDIEFMDLGVHVLRIQST